MNQTLHKDALTINYAASKMVLVGNVPSSENVIKVAA